MTFQIVIILINSAVNKNENSYYYNIFLEKGLYKDKSDTQHFRMNVCILWKLYWDRIDISEGTDVNKTSASKGSNICH